MRPTAQHVSDSTIAGSQYKKVKPHQAAELEVSNRLAKFIRTFHPHDAIALEQYSKFLLTVYDNLFASFTYHKQPAGPDADEGRTFIYMLLSPMQDAPDCMILTNYTRVVADNLYEMFPVGNHKTGALKINYDYVYQSLMRSFFCDNSWARQEITHYSHQLTDLINCFEYPQGVAA